MSDTTAMTLVSGDETKAGPKARPTAMAFYHGEGLIPSYNFARHFAGEGGRIATMLDIWNVRLAQLQNKLDMEPCGCAPWDTYYTTTSAEYMGHSRGGNLIIIVTHGIGPMRDLDWMIKAYRHQFRDKEREIGGGRIDREEFLRLESGGYGEVSIVDLRQYMSRYRYPFISDISYEQALTDPLLHARLGTRWHECALAQKALWERWYEANQEKEDTRLQNWGVSNPRPPCIFGLNQNSKLSYTGMISHPNYLEKVTENGKYAIGHLLTVGAVSPMNYAGSDADHTGVVSETDLHSWYDGTRFVGIRAGSDLSDIHPGPNNLRPAIRKYWEHIGVPAGQKDSLPRERPFYRLDDTCEFSVRQDDDLKIMQGTEPEFKVRGATELGRNEFVTEIEGYHGFLRYCPKDVQKFAPPEANAFNLVGDGEIVQDADGNPTHHKIGVVFYRANIDTTLRLPTEAEILKDFDLVLKLTLDEI